MTSGLMVLFSDTAWISVLSLMQASPVVKQIMMYLFDEYSHDGTLIVQSLSSIKSSNSTS